ncbi:MAG: FapA family protein [Atribacterota bacterium]
MGNGRPLSELEREGYFQLMVSGDRMKAELVVKRTLAEDDLKLYEDLVDFLAQKGICFGLTDEVKNGLELLKRTSTYLLAEGIRPQKGKDGTVRLLFEEEIKREFQEDEEGRIDFYDFMRVPQVLPGEVLAELLPPEEGVPGKDVFGREVPAPLGKPAKIVVGKNVELSPDGSRAIARAAGRPVVVGKAISVLPLFEVDGNVGVGTGNISFVGSILVRGDVESDFVVEAEGDVEVWGNVEAAKIVAGGNVRIRGGVFGKDRGSIQSKGNLQARVLENVSVEAEGDVVVERAILHSKVFAKGNVIVRGNPGAIIGGVIKSGDVVWARTLGSSIGARTEVIVGIDPALHDEYRKIQEDLKRIQGEIQEAEKVFRLILVKQQAGIELDERTRQVLDKVKKGYELAQEGKKFREDRLLELEGIFENHRGKILVEEKVYPQVRVTIGRFTYIVRDEIQYVSFSEKNKEVMIGSFERPKLSKR